MKFSIGDRVKLKHTREEGHVVADIGNNMLEVDAGGVIFPVFADELDHPYLDWFTNKEKKVKKSFVPEQLPVEKKADRIPKLTKGIYLSFVPVFVKDSTEDIVDFLKIYLVNELPADVKFIYEQKAGETGIFKLEGTMHAFGNVYLHNVPYANMNDKPRFHWRVTNVTTQGLASAEGILKLKPEKLFDHINQLLKNNEPAFSILLITDFEPQKIKLPPPPLELPKPVTFTTSDKYLSLNKVEPARHEIDLHIEALVSNTRGLTNSDMLKLQLDTLERYLHLAIVHRQHSLIVIHGLGKGTLKEEVHKILKQTKEVSRYKNEWSAKYGFGATEIFFRY